MNCLKTYVVAFAIFFSAQIGAQDLHFSQFYHSPQLLNPSLTGVFDGQYRFGAMYRNQWAFVPVPYTTFTGSFDTRILEDKMPSGILGVGGTLVYDRAGDSKLRLFQLLGSAAYSARLNEKSLLSAGLQLGLSQRRFNLNDLSFDNQFNGDIYDPNLGTGESFSRTSFGFIDLSAGINYNTSITKNASLNIGASRYHLNTPSQSFYKDSNSKLLARSNFHARADLKINEKINLSPAAILQLQGTYRELILGSSLTYHLDRMEGRQKAGSVGIWLRPGDAILFSASIHYLYWRVGFSYDYNVSAFDVATSGAGGPELSLQYIIKPVKPLKIIPACPVF